MPPPRHATLTIADLRQVRRGVLTLQHLAHDVQEGAAQGVHRATVGPGGETVTSPIDRGQQRQTLQ
jgi:hypothetical protein